MPLLISHWASLIAGLIVFLTGAMIRINREEKLLEEASGQEFHAYSASVPSLVRCIY